MYVNVGDKITHSNRIWRNPFLQNYREWYIDYKYNVYNSLRMVDIIIPYARSV